MDASYGEAICENKDMCIDNPIVKGQYDEATEIFYLKNAYVVIAYFSGNLLKEYKL